MSINFTSYFLTLYNFSRQLEKLIKRDYCLFEKNSRPALLLEFGFPTGYFFLPGIIKST